MKDKTDTYVLVVRCPERTGIVAAISTFLAARDLTITESSQYSDPDADTFFMRVVFAPCGAARISVEQLRESFAPIGEQFAMTWALHDQARKPRVMIAVSRSGHCVYDLLHRWRSGLLPMEIPAVISNHDDMRSFVEWNGLTYHHLPVSASTRAGQERRIISLVEDLRIDLVVLARYMQVLSPELCECLNGMCINIHHSFLPGFKGAKPYHQAHARGVKVIGATAHYVTTDLDEGPIIAQDTRAVTHAHSPEELVAIGQDVECTVLARAVTWSIEHRIIRNGNRTVVFA